MSIPKVFVSSTCYDFAEERDGISMFCEDYGFHTALSDKGDVFYHPELHTHEACVSEVANCQMMILLIGGRFGGEYVVDKTKSITNAEYSAARENHIPVYAFIKSSVWRDHLFWSKNKKKSGIEGLEYPSIDNQMYATSIFEFIDEIRRSPTNNAIYPFETSRDIKIILKKQWAGMLFEQLRGRTIMNQLMPTTAAVSRIEAVSSKIEEWMKNIGSINKSDGHLKTAETLKHFDEASKMFVFIAQKISDKQFLYTDINVYLKTPPKTLAEFLTKAGFFKTGVTKNERRRVIYYDVTKRLICEMDESPNAKSENVRKMMVNSYEAFKSLSVEMKFKLVLPYTTVGDDSKSDLDGECDLDG